MRTEARIGTAAFPGYDNSRPIMQLAEIGTRVHVRRRALGLSQEQLARLAGLSRATVNQLLRGALKDCILADGALELQADALHRLLKLESAGLGDMFDAGETRIEWAVQRRAGQGAYQDLRMVQEGTEVVPELELDVLRRT